MQRARREVSTWPRSRLGFSNRWFWHSRWDARRPSLPSTHVTSAVQAKTRDADWTWYERAVAYEQGGDPERAAEAFRHAEDSAGESHFWERSVAIYGRARALDGAGRCEEAAAVYKQYADMVRAVDPASAAMATAISGKCYTPSRPNPILIASSSALVAGDNRYAMDVSEGGDCTGEGSTAAWVAYDRAVALSALGFTNEAVVTFRSAEQSFADQGDDRGRLLSLYGRARAFNDAYMCAEAQDVYREYASLVQDRDPADAARVRGYGADCR